MPFPYRSLKNVQPLPSIYTAFPVNHDIGAQTSIDSAINSGTCLIRHIEDGIEVVPFERCNNATAPILSPDQDEKEVFFATQTEVETSEKPLPNLPGNAWQRMSIRQRILALLLTQFLMLMAIGLALLAAKRHSLQSDYTPPARTSGNEIAHTTASHTIQRGMFAVSIQLPEQQSSTCLANINESVAWQCASNTSFQLSILPSPAGNTNTTFVAMGPLLSNTSLKYGPGTMDIQPTQLIELANNTYQFTSTYDKIVYLGENDLASPDSPSAGFAVSHATFQPGESLWRCTFKKTTIEGYIYAEESSTSINMNETETPAGVPSLTTAGIPSFAYLIKLVEETTPDAQNMYCEKAIVQVNGSITTATKPANVLLAHSESATKGQNNSRTRSIGRARPQMRAESRHTKSCRCEWFIQ
ncbi:hypothetical protein NX059_004384 [Plenodomus lindquistii]|nr:hypothetical protein NX059_004384 [Plenodomus lindquistii]